MGRRRDTPDFTRSNKLPALKYQPTSQERELTGKLIASTSAHEREALGQKLLDNICRALKISRTRLRVSDERQPHKLRGGKLAYKLYGVYYCENAVIEIANLTSIREQVVAGKTFLDTLIHELMHHIDRKISPNTIHPTQPRLLRPHRGPESQTHAQEGERGTIPARNHLANTKKLESGSRYGDLRRTVERRAPKPREATRSDAGRHRPREKETEVDSAG